MAAELWGGGGGGGGTEKEEEEEEEEEGPANSLCLASGPIIVGAGPSGLAAAACLRRLGIPSLILERSDGIAALWRHGTYDRIHLHLPKPFCELPHEAIPSHMPTYLSGAQFVEYLTAYAARFSLRPRFNERVTAARFDQRTGLWRVRTVRNHHHPPPHHVRPNVRPNVRADDDHARGNGYNVRPDDDHARGKSNVGGNDSVRADDDNVRGNVSVRADDNVQGNDSVWADDNVRANYNVRGQRPEDDSRPDNSNSSSSSSNNNNNNNNHHNRSNSRSNCNCNSSSNFNNTTTNFNNTSYNNNNNNHNNNNNNHNNNNRSSSNSNCNCKSGSNNTTTTTNYNNNNNFNNSNNNNNNNNNFNNSNNNNNYNYYYNNTTNNTTTKYDNTDFNSNSDNNGVRDYAAHWLIIASGENAEAVLPPLPGLAKFRGPVLHSQQYKNGRPFESQRVLVVGAGNSGMEIALDLLKSRASPSLVVRNAVHVLPQEILGESTFAIILMLVKIFPVWIADRILLFAAWCKWRNTAKCGLPRPKEGPIAYKNRRRRTPVLDIGTLRLVKSGHIKVFPAIKTFTPDGAHFTDGQFERFDSVILATGYRSNVRDWLVGQDDLFTPEGFPSPQGCIGGWKGRNGLYVVGMSGKGLAGTKLDAQLIAKDIQQEFDAPGVSRF